MSRSRRIRVAGAVAILMAFLGTAPGEETPRNVLFIAVDDLRVELGCYGSVHVLSPNIDGLAERGVLFERAYCQQTVCNPSRASVLTGLRPDTLGVWDLVTHFRENVPDAVTLPQLFARNGYHARCVGKIFHNWRQDDWKGDPDSWSVPSVLHYNSHGNDKPMVDGKIPPNLASGRGGTECRDVPDEAYFDGRVARAAVEALREIAGADEPFFLAVGFWKPHTPFNAPKKYWDLYERGEVPVPEITTPPKSVPDIALTKDRFDGADSERLREMHHGHLAAITYLDAQVGKVLAELDALGLRDDTVVVFWSDHGLHLGEHGLTRKTTAFDLDARVPLLIDAPGFDSGKRTDGLVELLDLYPTLADLCDLEAPADLEGASLVPLLEDPSAVIKPVALTQTPRPNYPRGKDPEVMGYSVRSPGFRYTEWREFASGKVRARELYDHRSDPGETRNVIGDSSHAAEVERLAGDLASVVDARLAELPDPRENPGSPVMLVGDWVPEDPHRIDHAKLPVIPSEHVVVSDVREEKGVNQHNYLAFHGGRFWAMWSDGPGIEDRVGQRVKFATSQDGLDWSDRRFLTPEPPGSGPGSPHYGTRTDQGWRWISRGFWQREEELYALASLDEAAGFFGPGLELRAFRLVEKAGEISWEDAGVVADDAINNFPPKKIPSGEWMMSRRPHDYKEKGVQFLVGGVASLSDWNSFPVLGTSSDLSAEEPLWWELPDGDLAALFRDNRRSLFLHRSFSIDGGRTWSAPVRTDFPDATSKLYGLRLSDGRYVLVSNSNPRKRDPLTLAIGTDGMTFDRLGWLVGGRHVDYPHLIEHDGHLLVAFAGGKQTVEVLRIRLEDLDALVMPGDVELPREIPPVGAVRKKDGWWIDLGDNGATLFVSAEMTVPPRGRQSMLSVATSKDEDRILVGIDAKGRLTGEVFRNGTTGEELQAGSTHSLLLAIETGAASPDRVRIFLGKPGQIPGTDEGEDLLAQGHSDANLAKVILRSDGGKPLFRGVRVADSREALSETEPLSLEP